MINFFWRKQSGMTLVEVIVAVAIIGILTAVAVPNLARYRDNYSFNNNASQVEYLAKYAKIYAMEHSVNVGICVDLTAKTVSVNNLGADRGANACSGTVVRSMVVDDHVSLSGTSMKFDPRGIMIYPGWGSNICVSYGGKSHKVTLGRVNIRVEEGTTCS